MDIDMSALRLLEREREIPLDLLIPTIEQALLVAYHKSPGAFEKARAELDRKSGHVTIWATEIDDDGVPIGEFEDTPAGFGRIAASTARLDAQQINIPAPAWFKMESAQREK
jgi:N utilization substance protein A